MRGPGYGTNKAQIKKTNATSSHLFCQIIHIQDKRNNKLYHGVPKNKIPVNKKLLSGTVPVNRELMPGIAPVNKELLTSFYIIRLLE